MSRIGLLLFLICFSGCRGASPWNFTSPKRVPPPPTGVIGNSNHGNAYYDPAPRPNVGQGATAWPSEDWPVESRTAPIGTHLDAFGSGPARSIPPASQANVPAVDPNQQASWVDPLNPSDSPGLHLSAGPSRPLVSAPPRVRGFQRVQGTRDLYVPQELADLRNPMLPADQPIRQASAYSNWQPRYDDVRR